MDEEQSNDPTISSYPQAPKRKRIDDHNNDEPLPYKIPKLDQSWIDNSNNAFAIIRHKIYLWTNHPDFKNISRFLSDIADTVSKPIHVHEYQITAQSLLRAKSLGRKQTQILKFLQKNMRNKKIPYDLLCFLKQNLVSFQCARLYLQEDEDENVYYLQFERQHYYNFPKPQKLQQILKFCHPKYDQVFVDNEGNTRKAENNEKGQHQISSFRFKVKDYEHNKIAEELFKLSVPVSSEKIITKNNFVKKAKYHDIMRGIGVIHCKDLRINLKAFTKLRQYQSQALRATVQKRQDCVKAKSGYIVLPCGAGKTLLGISICTKVKKQTLIVCSSDSGADQWKRQIEKWTQGVARDQIILLTAKNTDDFKWKDGDRDKPHIYISTYSNLKSKFLNKQGLKSQHYWMKLMPWGLIIFDEVQWLPAQGNQQILNFLIAHVKVGLTATPMRQDNKIKCLNYLLGPQLYMGDWKSFVQHGYLANPKCIEIRTKMTQQFSQYYRDCQVKDKRQICYMINPNKIKALMYLLNHHQRLDDNIIVFCDKVDLVVQLAKALKKPLLAGQSDRAQRNFVFDKFREGVFKTIFLTRVGDQAIDLPNANVAIQLNIKHGSRKQMLQRLGRIMRVKPASSSQSYNAIFYTIVSDDTLQMKYFMKRHNCLVDLGFKYDLRVFDFGLKGDVPQLMKDDPQGRKQATEQLKKFIPDEEKYWNRFQHKKK